MSSITKAKDSFKTKINLFLYERVVQNQTEFSLNDFKKYQVLETAVSEYVTVYWQENTDYRIHGKAISQIEVEIKEIKARMEKTIKECESHYVSEVFPKLFSKTDFNGLIAGKQCYYCGITTERINELANLRRLRKKHLRGWSLEIDRLDSNYEYSPDNCVMCCYWCNNAKTDEFTPEEFRKVGEVIAGIWESRRVRPERFASDGSEMRLVDL